MDIFLLHTLCKNKHLVTFTIEHFWLLKRLVTFNMGSEENMSVQSCVCIYMLIERK